MVLRIFISICLSIFITIILSFTPLLLGLWVLIIAIVISVIIGIVSTSWFGFIVFLIYVGGMLVIFVYFAAIQPNQQISFLLIVRLTIYITAILIVINISGSLNSLLEDQTILSSLYVFINIPLLVFLALVLFLVLVAVVKISILFQGPLRPFIKYVFILPKITPSFKNC